VLAAAALMVLPSLGMFAAALVDHRDHGLPLDSGLRLLYAMMLLAAVACSVVAVYVLSGPPMGDLQRGLALVAGVVVGMCVAGMTVLVCAAALG
jgi:hypothetical protein